MTASHALTGLCSFAMRTNQGRYIYDPSRKADGMFLGDAYLWLVEPEHAEARAKQLMAEMPWAGQLTPVRAR